MMMMMMMMMMMTVVVSAIKATEASGDDGKSTHLAYIIVPSNSVASQH